ncbi:protein flp-like [Gigantopelta aegis]|uniref:protein flp-like n=1 Tax=Gigantopelta aegis TaxID=1735272 RepID=UPI001B889752|nr:protein flp-like [Gigantopelta aegis]
MGPLNLLCVLAVAIRGGVFCQTDPHHLIDEVVSAGLQCHKTPGLAVAVVKDGQVVLSKGYGFADVETQTPVTGETLFGIASNTKAFTTTLLVKLLSRRSDLKISTNVYRVLGSGFKFNNTLRSIYATLEDLAAHRLGIPRNNYIRLDTSLTRRNLERRVKYLKSVGGFRDSFYYSDLMYGLLANIIERIGGADWESLTQTEIFDPLHMTSSNFSTRFNFNSATNAATPYVVEHGVLVKASTDFIKHWAMIGASGAILSNANDMAKWLLFHLADGKNEDGLQVVDKSALADTYKARNTIGSTGAINKYFHRPAVPVTTSNDGYALGWKTGYYRGLPMVQHTGSTFGYRSIVTLIPSQKLGVFIVMTGSDPNYFFRNSLQDYIADVYMGETPWLNKTTICTFPSPWHSSRRRSVSRRRVGRLRNVHASLQAYVGTYRNEAYGNIIVTCCTITNKLHAVYGYGRWNLVEDRVDDFDGSWTRGPPNIDVKFKFMRSGGAINALNIPTFYPKYPPVFFRIENGNNIIG